MPTTSTPDVPPAGLTPAQIDTVEAHIGLVYRMLERRPDWQRRLVTRDDAAQEGFLGLMRAAQLYDATVGVEFTTYACVAILNRMKRAALTAGIVRVPETDSEVARQAMTRRCVSLAGREEDGNPWDVTCWRSPDPAKDAEDAEGCDLLAGMLRTLPARDAQVIRLYWLDDLTLDEVGRKLGITRERVRQIADRGLQKLRHRAKEMQT